MKFEYEIRDIERGELIEAMAQALLTDMISEYDAEAGGNYEYPARSKLAKALGKLVKDRIDQLAREVVREYFDETIKARIAATVDEVLDEGWRKSDNYGNATGDKIDLKGRINEIITEKKSNGYDREKFTLAEKIVAEKVSEVLTKDLNGEISKARASLRSQLDAVVAGKVAETIKQALGLK